MPNYRPYPAYQPTNIDWLCEIPTHWKAKRLKYGFQLLTEKAGEKENPVGLENIEGWSGQFIETESEFQGDGIAFQKGDILFGKLRPYLAKVYLAEFQGEAVGDFHVMRPTADMVGKFALYQCLNKDFITTVDSSTYGAKMPRVSWEYMANMLFAFPSFDEQQQIAAFLDRETAKIDQLIEKQQQLIELLKEKRQAVISHAVTKGLNPQAKMKPSGVEWLGDVPEHWVVKRLKHISPSLSVGLVINPSTYTTDEGRYFLFGGDIIEYGFKLEKTRKISPKDSEKLYQSKLEEFDLVTVRVGYPGITAVVPKELDGSNCASMMIIRCGEFISDWLCYSMNSWVGRKQVERVQYGAAQKQFNISDAVNFLFPTPPITEQKAIAAYLMQQNEKFGVLMAKAQRQIGLLRERRSALISAAVTGKIDVRDSQANKEAA